MTTLIRLLCSAGLAALALAAPAGAAAPPPAQVVSGAVDGHNKHVQGLRDFVKGVETQHFACGVSVSHGVFAGIEEVGRTDEQFVGLMRQYNKSLDTAVTALKDAKLNRAQRTKMNAAIKLLESAHTAHGKEFFHLQQIGASLEAHNCQGLIESQTAASNVGTGAWQEETSGLRKAAEALGVKGSVDDSDPYTYY
jgi:hypothetical protein